MGQTDVMRLLELEGASKDMGAVIVPEHVDKIKVRRCARVGPGQGDCSVPLEPVLPPPDTAR
jgi:hypothetical protein